MPPTPLISYTILIIFYFALSGLTHLTGIR
jgi:hypothetical protein